MKRDQETLSTRDLAPADDLVADVDTASDSAGQGREPDRETPAEVYDREAAEQGPESDGPAGTDSSALDIRSQRQGGVGNRGQGNAPAQSALAESERSPALSTAEQPRPAPSSGGDVTARQPENVTAPVSPPGSLETAAANGAPLLSDELSMTFRRRWEEVQTRFVDEPRGAVEDADGLVANLMQQLAKGFAQERERLEAQWGRGEDISTEDLRVALQRYRSFFQRLLSTSGTPDRIEVLQGRSDPSVRNDNAKPALASPPHRRRKEKWRRIRTRSSSTVSVRAACVRRSLRPRASRPRWPRAVSRRRRSHAPSRA